MLSRVLQWRCKDGVAWDAAWAGGDLEQRHVQQLGRVPGGNAQRPVHRSSRGAKRRCMAVAVLLGKGGQAAAGGASPRLGLRDVCGADVRSGVNALIETVDDEVPLVNGQDVQLAIDSTTQFVSRRSSVLTACSMQGLPLLIRT